MAKINYIIDKKQINFKLKFIKKFNLRSPS